MQRDWLFQYPKTDAQIQREFVAERMAEDPTAAAISDREAEEFFVCACVLRYMDTHLMFRLWQALRVRMLHSGEKAQRRAILSVLRRWQEPGTREVLLYAIPHMEIGAMPPATRDDLWTDALFQHAYQKKLNIVWLAYVRRYLGRDGDLSAWFAEIGPLAEQHYRWWLDVSRLTLRRLVYPEASPAAATEEVAAAVMVDLPPAPNRRPELLRKGVKRLEQERRQLKEQARREELQARSSLSQARGEVNAARKQLKQEQAAMERELAAREAQFEREASLLRARWNGARTAFVRSLRQLPRVDLLWGAAVKVGGLLADREACRLLVESVGGVLEWQQEGPDAVGVLALEERLRGLSVRQVLIKCDGLYRRKGRRPGIAIAAFAAETCGRPIFRDDAVVSCGGASAPRMAEYGALVLALRWLLACGPAPGSEAEIWSDCKFMLRDLWAEKSHPPRGCVQLDRTVRRLLRQLRERGCAVRLLWVPREQVEAVDRLCDKAYRRAGWYHRLGPVPTAPLERFLKQS